MVKVRSDNNEQKTTFDTFNIVYFLFFLVFDLNTNFIGF